MPSPPRVHRVLLRARGSLFLLQEELAWPLALLGTVVRTPVAGGRAEGGTARAGF